MNCPYCHKPLALVAAANPRRVPDQQGRYKTRTPLPMHVAGIVANQTIEDTWQTKTFSEPARDATRESDVIVPFQQAAITGGLVAILVLTLSVFVFSRIGWRAWWPWWYSPVVGILAGLVVTFLRWQNFISDSRALLWRVENYTGLDVDDDGFVGEPTPAPKPTIRLEVKQNEGRTQKFSEFPVTENQFQTWANAALNGRSVAVGEWTGSEGIFTRQEYDDLMAFMEDAGVIRWNSPGNPAQGRSLTRPGQAALREWMQPPSPTA